MPSVTYQLKITLLEITPPIWRRICVPSTILLCCLHDALQAVMGWTDCHLHLFEKDGKNWSVPAWDEFCDFDFIDESKTQLARVLKSEGTSMVYEYDFGDAWRHELLLEKILPESSKCPTCVAGDRRCPPEDVGGVSGYEEFLEVICDPSHEEYEHYVGWAGGHFEDRFDVAAVNTTLSRMRWPLGHRRQGKRR